MLSSSNRSYKLKITLGEKVKNILDLRYILILINWLLQFLFSSHNIQSFDETREVHAEKICQLLHFNIPSLVFDSNLQSLGLRDDIFLFKVMNAFSLWGPHEALKHVLRNKNFIKRASEEFNGFLNLVVLLTSPTLGKHSNRIRKNYRIQCKFLYISN